jgi:hypothetical protein
MVQMLEQPKTLAEKYREQANLEFVEKPGVETLLC